ncbi:hypothetical protein OEZ85_012705 [Tetradesmus obliquus]|uniref:Uncharacterized protein n=1 Tax=Tetradesmus obliquus TaxID=3088 RepID=A0ABY8U4E1_TETOB|nr:hypothetical protein OEZ85_012705 [Tetradesmus obliquus]
MKHTYGYPAIYVARYQKNCTDHPASAFGKVHDYSSAVDRTVAFSLQNKATGKAVKPANGVSSICSGDTYLVKLAFGEPSLRNYLLTSSHGSFVVKSNDCDAWCANRVCSSAPTKEGSALFSVPCSIAGGTKVTFKVTSANGRIPALGAELRSASLTLKVDSNSFAASPHRSHAIAPLQATYSKRRQGHEQVVAFLADNGPSTELPLLLHHGALVAGPVHFYKAGLHINGSYAEVWLPKAIKQWLFFEGGEDALGGWYALATVLDGDHVCSQTFHPKRKHLSVSDALRIALSKTAVANVSGAERVALKVYRREIKAGEWLTQLVLELSTASRPQQQKV